MSPNKDQRRRKSDQEVKEIVDQVLGAINKTLNGDLSVRIKTDGWSDEFRDLGKDVNTLIDLTQEKATTLNRCNLELDRERSKFDFKEKKIDEIKNDFIAIASHQLRTPLTVATLHTEMLLAGHAGKITREQREYLKEINIYNKKMADLLNTFLAVTRIELESFTVNAERINLTVIVDDMLHELSHQISQKKLSVERKYDKNLPEVMSDRELIKIAIQNLVSNAVKYTPDGGKIKITMKKDDRCGVLVNVKDSGFGISEEDKERVFTKMYRGETAKRNDHEGSGLGLYIAKSFIEKCGAKIWFDSKENSGASFFVSIPLEIGK